MKVVQLLHFGKDERGQALVEFALILPFLLLFLVGIVEFGRAWNLHQVITDATREAARKSAVWDPAVTADTVRNVAKRAIRTAGVDTSTVTVNVNESSAGSSVVSITVPYRLLFFGELKQWTTGEATVLLRSSFTMRNE